MSQRDYHIGQILQMGACTGCRLCADVCPAVSATLDGQLSGIYRLEVLRKIMRFRKGLFRNIFPKRRLSEDELRHFSETVYRCTLCGRCQEVCPSGISLKKIWLCLRHDLVHSSNFPEKVGTILENITKSHNVFNEDNEERSDWVNDLRESPDHGYIKYKADVVYFTGCVSAYFPMAQKIPIALVEILKSAGVDFTLLGHDEWCCGFPLLSAGLKDHIDDVIEHNLDAVRQKGAQKVVFACPSCYRMWKEYYPREFEVFHVTQFLNELISSGRLHLKNIDMTVTYHDPCDLGRGSHEYESPRGMIRSIPGIKLVEMEHNRESCICCGGGGNLEIFDPVLSSGIAGTKMDEVMRTGAQAVVTSCQQCVRIMNSYARRNKMTLDVMDIVQLIQKALT
jgi:heterodisulfide reductase subunit D